jgi:hypothetical protein
LPEVDMTILCLHGRRLSLDSPGLWCYGPV